MCLSQILHRISVCLFENIHNKFLHISFMLLFTESQVRPDTTVMNSFGGEFFLASFLKAYCSTLPFSSSSNIAPSTSLKMQLQCFFGKCYWTHVTPSSFAPCQLNDDNSERKNMQLLRLRSGEKDVLGHLLERLGGKKEGNKMFFKIHVVHLHTHENHTVIGNPHGWVVVLHYALSYSTLAKTWVDHFHMEIPWLCKIIVKDKMHITRGDRSTHKSVQLFKLPML